MKDKTYKMYYVSGGGTQHDGGTWTIKETSKTYKFTKIKDGYFSSQMPECIIRKEKERRHSLGDWEDGTYTVYPFQSGTPHYFQHVA